MRYFEDLYSTYQRAYGEGPSHAAQALVEVIGKDAKVVDVGCGYGRDCIYLAKQGLQVTGFDTSRRGIMAAQIWAQQEGLDCTFLTRDLMDNKLPERSFDAILAVNILDFLEPRKRAKAGSELWKLASEGAYLGLMVHSTEDLDLRCGRDLGDNTREVMPGLAKHFFTNREIKSIIPDFKETQMELVTVIEPHPERTEHRYWSFIGQRP